MTRKTEIEVFKGDGKPGSDTEHIVQVSITEDDRPIGKGRFPGGNHENAVAMATGLKNLADQGVDLSSMLPDTDAEAEG